MSESTRPERAAVKVLIATDGSDDAVQAARFFSRLPHDQPLDVTVITVLDPPDVSISTPSATWYPEFLEQQREFAEASCARIANLFEGANATVRSVHPQGHAGNTIVHQAAEDKADLIVIGAKGHSAIARMFIGSVSNFVATHADCSVLVVRPPDEQTKRDESLRVTIAYNGSEPSEAAVEEFTRFPWTGNVFVQILSIIREFRAFRQDLIPIAQEHAAEQRHAAHEKANQVAGRLKKHGIHASAQVATGEHVGESIVSHAHDYQSDLVVLGNTSRGLLPRLLLGSVSAYVLRHAKQSVWIVRRRKR